MPCIYYGSNLIKRFGRFFLLWTILFIAYIFIYFNLVKVNTFGIDFIKFAEPNSKTTASIAKLIYNTWQRETNNKPLKYSIGSSHSSIITYYLPIKSKVFFYKEGVPEVNPFIDPEDVRKKGGICIIYSSKYPSNYEYLCKGKFPQYITRIKNTRTGKYYKNIYWAIQEPEE